MPNEWRLSVTFHSLTAQPAPTHPKRDLARASVPVALDFGNPEGGRTSVRAEPYGEEVGRKKSGSIILSFQVRA